MAKVTLLDDLLSPAELAKVNAQRAQRGKHDLSDLIPKPAVLSFGPPLDLTLFLQVSRCRFCGTEHTLPLNVVVRHELFRGNRSLGFVSIPLAHPGEHPSLRLNHHFSREEVDQCHLCFERARQSKPHYALHEVPKPGTELWLQMHAAAHPEALAETEKYLADREENADRLDERELSSLRPAIADKQATESWD